MIYNEVIGDLFKYDKDYALVHCISADSGHDARAMGAGIVTTFNKRYNMKNKMLQYGKFKIIKVGDAVFIDNIFNLITKTVYYTKPTYINFEKTLVTMKDYCTKNNIKKLAMPTIGCGIDRLEWDKVKKIIEKVFNDTDIEILVCFFNETEWDKWHTSNFREIELF